MNAYNLPKNEQQMDTAAPPITLLQTLVTAMTPNPPVGGRRHRTHTARKCGRKEICEQGPVQPRLLQKIAPNNLSRHYLMTNVLRCDQQQRRKNRQDCL